ncbi:hypothetical protein OG777_00215 [Micromonospora peucetia]|uniref:Uncharacterized protein n=1 Tax=Micromonospora peucetia TaxID=47871 RepID=A0A1C6W5F2_9ACTN|nr:hypothetical protein [Micromonospora peucetia]MCX4385351.1 hypothetical protein [Micromonospora peucetia]WSA32753.1 hypothetical protein OIE14_01330 [Micromonospora peucetia]SCL73748.1 hypothetical protein GA0070608_6062 [Micromonospora peucetia]
MTTHPTGPPTTGASVPSQPERRRWWHAFLPPAEPVTLFPPPAPPVPSTVTFRHDVPQPILVPAWGDAFDFRLHAVYTWTAQNMAYEELRLRAERHLAWAGGIVRDRAVDLARQYEPHRSHDLERALNDRLTGQRWPREGSQPHFWVQVRVSPDERVRERLRPYWEERIKLECDHELQKIRAQQADELTRRWCTVLQSLEDDPVTAHAARLTGEQFAEVFRRYVQERRETVPDLVALLREAVRGHGDLGMGPSEYTEAWDAAIRTYERRHGLSDRVN